jgi:uncharacterized protein with NAD-binding domain and iron-sulfur cluster
MSSATTAPTGLTRRAFLTGAGAGATMAAASSLLRPAFAVTRSLSGNPRRPTVAVFGGGVAGLTTAHELAERGLDVTVYERRAWGGKARSMAVPGTAAAGRSALPGEHGFRIEFGFYQNLPDTLRRIPFGHNPNGVFDNLVAATQVLWSRVGRRGIVFPVYPADPRATTAAQVRDTALAIALQGRFTPQAAAYFADRMTVFFSSCDARRLGQWENVAWADFIGADRYGEDYREILANGFTHFLQASKAGRTSTKFVGWWFEAFIYTLLGRGANGPLDRVFNLPTTEAWIAPWLAQLKRLGGQLRIGHQLEGFHLENGRIASAAVRGPSGPLTVIADWYVCALPVERATQLWTPAILETDPDLARTSHLPTAWMNGIQLYLRRPTPVVHGHAIYFESPWALSSISQAQFWAGNFSANYGDGVARDCLSVVISDWTTPGVLYGKPASQCSPNQVVREVWEQIKLHLNRAGETVLTDDLLLSWHIDPGVIGDSGVFRSEDPLVLPTVGAWPNRPESQTGIPNLILAGDYVRSDWEMANMETANASGRLAANAILSQTRTAQSPVPVIPHYRPPEWEALKRLDEARYRADQPNIFDSSACARLQDLPR